MSAHPTTLGLDYNELFKIIEELKGYGLSGIEIINGKLKNVIFQKYQQIAMELDLLETVGSDFHEPKIDEIGISINERIYDNIEKKLIKSRK